PKSRRQVLRRNNQGSHCLCRIGPRLDPGGNDPPHPPSSPSTASLSGVARCWHNNAYFSLFSSLFFFDPPNRFVQIPRDLFIVSILLALLFSLLPLARWRAERITVDGKSYEMR